MDSRGSQSKQVDSRDTCRACPRACVVRARLRLWESCRMSPGPVNTLCSANRMKNRCQAFRVDLASQSEVTGFRQIGLGGVEGAKQEFLIELDERFNLPSAYASRVPPRLCNICR